MALYEYKCRHCDKITVDRCKWEERRMFVNCEHCGHNAQYIQSLTATRTDKTIKGY